MRVSVYFYKNLDPASVVWGELQELKKMHPDAYWIGVRAGFGVANLSWHEAYQLAERIAFTVKSSDCITIVNEMRLVVQEDQEECSHLALDTSSTDIPPPP